VLGLVKAFLKAGVLSEAGQRLSLILDFTIFPV
jgi:hypothetical protein